MAQTALVTIDPKLLQVFENIKKSVAEIDDIVELRGIKNLAAGYEEAWRGYYRSSGLGFEQMVLGWETKIRSERRMGELLPKLITDRGGRPGKNRSHDETGLDDLGISKTQSYRYQMLAKIDEELFEKEIERIKSNFIEPTTKAILNLYKEQVREEKAAEGENVIVPQEVNLICDSFLKAKIEDNSLDLIITDPPYQKEDLSIWKELGKFARLKLKPSKFLIAYTGLLYLPQVITSLNEYMDYYWTFAMLFTSSPIVSRVNIIQRWKAILIYQKPPFKRLENTTTDLLIGGEREKGLHDWQQSEWHAEELIKMFSNPGEVVCDPLMGAGTFSYVAFKLGRKSIGIEIDKNTFNVAKSRFS